MKKFTLFLIIGCVTAVCTLPGCGGGDPNAGGGALPTAGLEGGAEKEVDPNGGVGFDDPSLGKDGQ